MDRCYAMHMQVHICEQDLKKTIKQFNTKLHLELGARITQTFLVEKI
jgi:hypothetical protein